MEENKYDKQIKITPRLSSHCFGTLVTKKQRKLFAGEQSMKKICEIVDRHQAHRLGELLHEFPNKSFTILIGLAESHISIHTWPERFTVQLDVFLCNYTNDNSEKCEKIFDEIVDYFEPEETDKTVLHRL